MQFTRRTLRQVALGVFTLCFMFGAASNLAARPPGYVKSTIQLDSAPAGVTFGSDGTLYVIEAPVDSDWATLQTILPDGSFGESIPVPVDDPGEFLFAGMAYHPQLGVLIADNTGNGQIYAVSDGVTQTLATGISGIAEIAVRHSGQIFASTAPVGSAGSVVQIGTGGEVTTVLAGLGYGAGLAFDPAGDLVVQDANASFDGRLQRLPITETAPGVLEFGSSELMIDLMQSTYDLAIDDEGDLFTTGSGGLFQVAGSPLVESLFDNNGNPYQYATAIAFDPGSQPFEPFGGADAGRLAYIADWSDTFITLLTPAVPGDYDGNGIIEEADFSLWKSTFNSTSELAADGNRDGIVNVLDYIVWRNNLEAARDLSVAQNAVTSAVPEPATVSLLGLALTLVAVRRRRAR